LEKKSKHILLLVKIMFNFKLQFTGKKFFQPIERNEKFLGKVDSVYEQIKKFLSPDSVNKIFELKMQYLNGN